MPQELKLIFALALFLAPIYLLLVWVNAALLGSNGAGVCFNIHARDLGEGEAE